MKYYSLSCNYYYLFRRFFYPLLSVSGLFCLTFPFCCALSETQISCYRFVESEGLGRQCLKNMPWQFLQKLPRHDVVYCLWLIT